VDVGPSEEGAFWQQFLRALVARGLHGVQRRTHPPSIQERESTASFHTFTRLATRWRGRHEHSRATRTRRGLSTQGRAARHQPDGLAASARHQRDDDRPHARRRAYRHEVGGPPPAPGPHTWQGVRHRPRWAGSALPTIRTRSHALTSGCVKANRSSTKTTWTMSGGTTSVLTRRCRCTPAGRLPSARQAMVTVRPRIVAVPRDCCPVWPLRAPLLPSPRVRLPLQQAQLPAGRDRR